MFSIIPRDTAFFDLFEQAAGIVKRTAETYALVVNDYANSDVHIKRIRELEHEGDDVVHVTLKKLDTTFITPFDREDIHSLMKHMDDVVDEIDAAAKRLTMYKIAEPTKWLRKQAEVLVKASALVGEAVFRLRNLGQHNGLHKKLVEIHDLENEGDENNHAAVVELYSNTTDLLLVMKLKEIYDLTERAIDRCEDIADIIEAIVLKNT
jgi:uncharacterized protein Yka (UPF0111/DUF47 family)